MIDDLDEAAELLLTDPMALFDWSVTQVESVDRATIQEVQRRAMGRRFAEHYAARASPSSSSSTTSCPSCSPTPRSSPIPRPC